MEPRSNLSLIGNAKLIERLLGPACDYLGQIILQLTRKMCDNIGKIFRNAEHKIGDRINEDGRVSPKALKSIIENGAWCEEDLQCEYFGGVLASARSSISRDDRGAYFSNMVAGLSSYQVRMHYLLYFEMNYLFKGTDYNICESATRDKLEIFIPLDTFLVALDFSEEETKRISELIPHIMFGLSSFGLIENNFLYGPKESLLERYSRADSYGIIVQPSQQGLELFMWAYGYGLETLSSFFSETIVFNPINGINIGQAYSTKI